MTMNYLNSPLVNVLQLHGTDSGAGGGPIAMLRLHEGLGKFGVQSQILCPRATRPDSVAIPHVLGTSRLRALTMKTGLNELHCLGSFKIPRMSAYTNTDLLHIHCLHGGFFHYLALPQLTRRKPAVYTLHDMWPFTGHCVYSLDCERWKSGCGECPYPEMPNDIRRDATRWEWKLKDSAYRQSKLTIVVPSTWMQRLASESMMRRFPIKYIPHGVDLELYRPLDQEMSRAALGITSGKRVLLYLVRRMNPSHKTSWIKGADVLVKALRELPSALKKETVLLLVGDGGEAFARGLDMGVISTGFVSSDRLKALAYSAADAFLFPSRADNAPLVLIETMACGTPTVAFNVGGVSDMVRPGVTGLLADPEDHKQFAARIVELLENTPLRAHMRLQARAIAEKEYPLDLYVERHAALYREVLASGAE